MNMQTTKRVARGLLIAAVLATSLCAPRFASANTVSASQRNELLRVREAVWRAWFAADESALARLVPPDLLAIDTGENEFKTQAQELAGARDFVRQNGRLLGLRFPRTEIQLFGDTAILYSLYELDLEQGGRRQHQAGRATEVFVRRNGEWTNVGWHMDLGK
jgi:ketosteroid isomerase-like protein